MTLDFQKELDQALHEIDSTGEYHELLVQENEEEQDERSSSVQKRQKPLLEADVIDKYGNSQWKVVDLLNDKYSSILQDKFDLHNWIEYNKNDEVAYFLSETGTNCLNYAEHRAPHKFHIWFGSKGFVIGVEQIGKSFSAEEINEKRIKENEGAAFEFFRNCKSTIFFDNSKETRQVFMECLF